MPLCEHHEPGAATWAFRHVASVGLFCCLRLPVSRYWGGTHVRSAILPYLLTGTLSASWRQVSKLFCTRDNGAYIFVVGGTPATDAIFVCNAARIKSSIDGSIIHASVPLNIRPLACSDPSTPSRKHKNKHENVEPVRLLRNSFARQASVHQATLQRRQETPHNPSGSRPPPPNPEERAQLEALRQASSEYRKLYGGAAKKALGQSLRAGTTGSAEERARFAALC
jgi:hypothetical protein